MSLHSYESPLGSRYASPDMAKIFSPHFKFSTWRKLWLALAEAQKELGLPIQSEQIKELKTHLNTIDFDAAQNYEKIFRHDVMAHIHAYGDQCPKARAIIHLGATSCFVTDNTDIIQIKRASEIILSKLMRVIFQLASFADKHADVACLGFTHFQPAQLTTVGKRTCLWIQDFLLDLHDLIYHLDHLKFLGVKGTTGTQASFMALFENDHDKVEALDTRVSEKMGFSNLFKISGQTYTRKQDAQFLNVLGGIAASAHKFGTDLRLLSHLREVEEPFEEKQIGSSAMPYKRNPIYAERMCSIARFVLSLVPNPSYTLATQWLERSLDDSANRRLSIPETFLACDAVLNLADYLSSGLIANPVIISKHVHEELPFMATENILMACVNKGMDRQALHEKLREHSLKAADQIKQGLPNDLLQRIANDSLFPLNREELGGVFNVRQFVGRAPQQVQAFIQGEIEPLKMKYQGIDSFSFHPLV